MVFLGGAGGGGDFGNSSRNSTLDEDLAGEAEGVVRFVLETDRGVGGRVGIMKGRRRWFEVFSG